jgi:hypothetical protein
MLHKVRLQRSQASNKRTNHLLIRIPRILPEPICDDDEADNDDDVEKRRQGEIQRCRNEGRKPNRER